MGIVGRLKDEQLVKRVRELKPGEKGWIYSSGVQFDMNKNPFLNLNATVYFKREGDYDRIPIKRIGPGEGDYRVDIRKSWDTWELSENPFGDEDPFSTTNYKKEIVQLSYEPSKNQRGNKIGSRTPKLEDLERELTLAVQVEDFTLAAKLRDQIRGYNPNNQQPTKIKYSPKRKNKSNPKNKTSDLVLPVHLL